MRLVKETGVGRFAGLRGDGRRSLGPGNVAVFVTAVNQLLSTSPKVSSGTREEPQELRDDVANCVMVDGPAVVAEEVTLPLRGDHHLVGMEVAHISCRVTAS